MKVKVAVIQDSPDFFNKQACFAQVEKNLEQCALENVELALFPESFIPGYPRGFDFGAVVGSRSDQGRELFRRYHAQCVDLRGPDRETLETLARRHGVFFVLGISERSSEHGSLFCSMVYVCPNNGVVGVHRKIKPTGTERLIWAEAGGESLVTVATSFGRLGGLICWENYMPLARMSMYQKGVQIYLAPTADARDSWIQSMQHIALEGRCFVLACNQYFTRSMYPEELQTLLPESPELICRGGSVIISPLGKILAGPLLDKRGSLIAHIDLDDIVRSKLDFDPVGHYNRPDIFEFKVHGQPKTRNTDD